MSNGWPDAGDNSNVDEIDAWVDYTGFTPMIQDPFTRFMLGGAPDPTDCWVEYTQSEDVTVGPGITTATSGC